MREWVLQQQVADEFVSVLTHFASANESEIRAPSLHRLLCKKTGFAMRDRQALAR
jgi:hypothetical protein